MHRQFRNPGFLRLSPVFFSVLLLASCSRQKTPTDALVKIGNTIITKKAFESELERRAKLGTPVATAADRASVLQDMIRLETFYAKAKANGYDQRPELVSQFKKMVAGQYEEDEWKKQGDSKRPENAEVEFYYKSHPGEFTSPEKLHVAIIVLKLSSKAGQEQIARAQARAEELHLKAVEEAGDRPDFGLLAQDNSEDQATRYRGGDCGWVTRHSPKFQWETNVVNALFALQKPGEVTPVIRTSDGFYFGKLIERRDQETAALDLVRDRIEHQLIAAQQKKKRQEFELAQRAGLEVEINDEMLKSIEAPAVMAKNAKSALPSSPIR